MSGRSAEVHHPLFARLYAVMARHEPAAIRHYRDELLAGLSGRVIEIGAGSGANFTHYPSTVTEVVAVEPEDYLREQAERAAADAPVPVTVVNGLADALPAEDATFDGAVACLVLCSVPDQASALTELRRALRPGGELRFLEHVVAPDRAALARTQRVVDRVFWPRAFGGCHTARDTSAAIAAAGFDRVEERRIQLGPGLSPIATGILGTARRG